MGEALAACNLISLPSPATPPETRVDLCVPRSSRLPVQRPAPCLGQFVDSDVIRPAFVIVDSKPRIAHDLLTRRGAVKIVTENRIPGTGLELTGKVVVAEDRREYRPQMLLADEGQVSRARHLLGRPFSSVSTAGRGRGYGIPPQLRPAM